MSRQKSMQKSPVPPSPEEAHKLRFALAKNPDVPVFALLLTPANEAHASKVAAKLLNPERSGPLSEAEVERVEKWFWTLRYRNLLLFGLEKEASKHLRTSFAALNGSMCPKGDMRVFRPYRDRRFDVVLDGVGPSELVRLSKTLGKHLSEKSDVVRSRLEPSKNPSNSRVFFCCDDIDQQKRLLGLGDTIKVGVQLVFLSARVKGLTSPIPVVEVESKVYSASPLSPAEVPSQVLQHKAPSAPAPTCMVDRRHLVETLLSVSTLPKTDISPKIPAIHYDPPWKWNSAPVRDPLAVLEDSESDDSTTPRPNEESAGPKRDREKRSETPRQQSDEAASPVKQRYRSDPQELTNVDP